MIMEAPKMKCEHCGHLFNEHDFLSYNNETVWFQCPNCDHIQDHKVAIGVK